MKFIALLVAMLSAIPSLPAATPSPWWHEAIWYQIFPERFRNGDPSNDPDRASLAGTWPYESPTNWTVIPWTADWYARQPWEESNGKNFFHNSQLRRFGGDLQGVIDKLDYLQGLGVTALYLNPIFESPSLHKYGAAYYHHVDNNFGPDPKGDAQLWTQEDPADPATWKWTAADKLFLELIRQCHARNMRVVIDGVFNHVGIPFWAFQKARTEGPESRFAKWFHIKRWDDPATPKDEFDYQGWVGIHDLPEFRKDAVGPHAEVKAHFRAVLRRWMDPNGDGNPEDGIDGWRLDVADQLPLTFWKEFRTWVKELNPNAFITGEIWWEDFGTYKLLNARPWLEGDAFDSVMNYRFADALFQFFNQEKTPITAKAFGELLDTIQQQYGYATAQGMQNLLGSHDTSRIGSVVVNSEDRLDHGAGLEHHRNYQVRKFNDAERRKLKQIVAFQFLSPGAPYIYYGDEVGMWGADDPDNRKPMVWSDLSYAAERSHPWDLQRELNPVAVDDDIQSFYRACIRFRREHPELALGDYSVKLADDARRLFAFRRSFQGREVIAIFNASNEEQSIDLQTIGIQDVSQWKGAFGSPTLNASKIPFRGYFVYWR